MLLGRPVSGRESRQAAAVMPEPSNPDCSPHIHAAVKLLVSAASQLSDAELRAGATDVLQWLHQPAHDTAAATFAAALRYFHGIT